MSSTSDALRRRLLLELSRLSSSITAELESVSVSLCSLVGAAWCVRGRKDAAGELG